VFVIRRTVFTIKVNIDAKPQVTFRDLDIVGQATTSTTCGGAGGNVGLVTYRIPILRAILASSLRQVLTNILKALVDRHTILKCESHLLLALWAKSVVAGCFGRVTSSDLFQACDLMLRRTSPRLVSAIQILRYEYSIVIICVCDYRR
jgi:hypothetical protein